jgi:hypothetical protein
MLAPSSDTGRVSTVSIATLAGCESLTSEQTRQFWGGLDSLFAHFLLPSVLVRLTYWLTSVAVVPITTMLVSVVPITTLLID